MHRSSQEADRCLQKQPMMVFWDTVAKSLDIETETVSRKGKYCKGESHDNIAIKVMVMVVVMMMVMVMVMAVMVMVIMTMAIVTMMVMII